MAKDDVRKKYQMNALMYWALKYSRSLTTEEELAQVDFTETFYKELIAMPKNGERINININGIPGKGKSTISMAIADYIMTNALQKTMGIQNICRTQIEYSKKMRDSNLNNTVLIIDEMDTLEKGGANATAEDATLNMMSDLHAQRFVHTIANSPQDQTDKNAEIYIEVLQPDKKRKITLCLLYYKIYKAQGTHLQLLGKLEIDVSQVINKDYYKEYRKRKFEKMDMLTKKGIFRARTLDYSQIIWIVTQHLKGLAEQGEVSKSLIRTYLKQKAEEAIIPTTMLSLTEWVTEVEALLEPYKARYKRKQRIAKLKKARSKTPMDTNLHYAIEQENKIIQDLTELIKTQTQRMVDKIRIAKKYAE